MNTGNLRTVEEQEKGWYTHFMQIINMHFSGLRETKIYVQLYFIGKMRVTTWFP